MYKLKNTFVDRMISERLSSAEIDFVLLIAKYQSENGTVESVYYKDVCSDLGISIQKFYDIIHSLSDKNFIVYEKLNGADIRIHFVENDFTNANYNKGGLGYISAAHNNFASKKFTELKAGAKLLYLYSQRFTSGKHMLLENFYNEFCKLLGVAKKTIQAYVHELKERKLLFISKKRNKAYNYEIMMKRSTVLHLDTLQLLREKDYYINNIVSLIKRNFKKYVDGCDSRVLQDIACLAVGNRTSSYKEPVKLVIKAIKKSLHLQQKEGKDKVVLNTALVNKCLTGVLEQNI